MTMRPCLRCGDGFVASDNSKARFCVPCRRVEQAHLSGKSMRFEPSMNAIQTERYLALQLRREIAAPWDRPAIEQEMRRMREEVSK